MGLGGFGVWIALSVSVLLGLGNENKGLRILYWELGILDRGIRLWSKIVDHRIVDSGISYFGLRVGYCGLQSL